jgi:hypothetical protein
MKILADGTVVSSRSFYFLLDYNDHTDKRVINNLWGVVKLKDLTKHQYIYLFKHAVTAELKTLET